MASVARDLGEDLTAEPLVELNVLLTFHPELIWSKDERSDDAHG